MTRKIIMIERKWFFSLQDGRESNEEFNTEEEAKAEFKRRKKAKTATGMYISFYDKQVTE